MLRRTVWSVVLLLPMLAGARPASAQEATATPDPEASAVHGVLFYSPTCPHCREVMTQTLPPIIGRYGDALKLVSVNTATPGGQELYQAMVTAFAVPRERIGVPTLLIGDRILVGSWEIPNLLPGIVDSALTTTGIDWPPVPLIRRALAAQGVIPEAEVAIAEPAEPQPEDGPGADTASNATEVAASDGAGGDVTDGDTAAASPAAQPVPGGDVEPAGAEAGAADQERRAQPEATPGPASERTPGSASGTSPETPAGTEAEGPAPAHSAAAAPAAGAGDEREGALDAAVAGAIQTDGGTALAHELSVGERVMLDPAGNGFAIAVLILMLVVLALVAADVAGAIRIPPPPPWAIPLLSLVGLGVAAYLAFVEVTGAEAVCGPVGHCNVVQQSPYARLLGVPVGILGVFGYASLLAVWSAGRLVGPWAPPARRLVWSMALGATGFSIYLTFLEPFVIGASCAWCLTSAVATTLILLAATPERYARDRVGLSPTSRPSVSH